MTSGANLTVYRQFQAMPFVVFWQFWSSCVIVQDDSGSAESVLVKKGFWSGVELLVSQFSHPKRGCTLNCFLLTSLMITYFQGVLFYLFIFYYFQHTYHLYNSSHVNLLVFIIHEIRSSGIFCYFSFTGWCWSTHVIYMYDSESIFHWMIARLLFMIGLACNTILTSPQG